MAKAAPLSDLKCRQAKYQTAGGNRLFDGGGLYLESLPSGSRKWRLKYRVNGKENRLTFGDYPGVSLAEARQRRDAAKRLLGDGIDPAQQREIDKQGAAVAAENTFEVVAREWFAIRVSGWSPGYVKKTMQQLERDLFPHLGKMPIASITAPYLLTVVKKVEARGTSEMPRRALDFCGMIYRYARATGRASSDISEGLSDMLKPRPPVAHYPHVTEAQLPELLKRVERYVGQPETKLAIKLLMLTFVRTAELRRARWVQFDIPAKEWRVPSEQMKGDKRQKASGIPHIVPLSRQTIATLEQLRLLTGRYDLLLPGLRNKTSPISQETINKALKILGFEGEQTGHGFRGLASTLLNERSDFRPDVIERQLSHKEKDAVRAAYNHAKHMDERRELMQWWGDFMEQKTGENVISPA
jgi:integrase